MLTAPRRWLSGSIAPWLHRVPVLRAIGKRLMRQRVIRQPFRGGILCLDAVEHSWLWTGEIRGETWDDDIQDRLIELSRGCRSLLDIGANIGLMALAVALHNPEITIVCVEPNARAAALLRRSIAANRLDDRVTVLEAVAGTADATVAFAEDASTTGHVTAGGALTRPSVDFARLVNEATARGRCLVKLDVEGYEAVILTALPRIASLSRVQLAMEVRSEEHADRDDRAVDQRARYRADRGALAVLSGG